MVSHWLSVCPSICWSVCRTSVHPSVFLFLDDNLIKYQWINFTKLCVRIDIVEIFFFFFFFFVCVCWGLTTRQPSVWVILCCLPEKGRKEIEEMKERSREERETGMKVKKKKK